MGYAFNSSTPSLRDAVNRLNRVMFKTQGDVGDIIAGGGSIAPNADVEKAVQWAIAKCRSGDVSYSMSNRHWKEPNAWVYDCSSFVITAFYYAGFDVPATDTTNMRAGFTSMGWTWIPGRAFTSDMLQRGDILLNEIYHTELYIGDGLVANCGSTPASIIHNRVTYRYSGAPGWDGVLRYAG